MELVVMEAIDLADHPDALHVGGGAMWTTRRDGGLSKRSFAIAATSKTIAGRLVADGGITHTDDGLLVAAATTRVLSSVDPESGAQKVLLDCSTLHGGKHTGGLRANNATINDICWKDGMVWLAVEAGYASCIVQIDVAAKKIVNGFWSPGPKPRGLAFDREGRRLWVIDGRNEQLVDLDGRGEWLGTAAAMPVPGMRHLSIDANDELWSMDAVLPRVYRMKREG